MPDERSDSRNKLKVFVSYSRRDLDFADQVVAVLSWQGFLPIIDRKGIHGAENWRLQLGQLILESDIVVFVLSPDSVTSDICNWEVEEAVRRGKRIIPVLCRPLEGHEPHEHLRALNYIHFYADKNLPSSGFGTGLVRFIDALSVDIEWLREHTRLEEMAARWDESNQDTDLLVRGSELSAFIHWREARPTNAPDLTTLQRAFLAASEDEEAARTSIERKRLAEIDAAQIERQAAIEEREAAVSRELNAQQARARAQRIIVRGSISGALLAVVGALAFSEQQQRNTAEQARLTAKAEQATLVAQDEKAALEELIRRIRVGISEPQGMTAMEKICSEAVSVTSKLASTVNSNDYVELSQRFWELYYGPMNLIELRQKTDKYFGDSKEITSSDIETAMVRFGNVLKNQTSSVTELPLSQLTQVSRNIQIECESYLS